MPATLKTVELPKSPSSWPRFFKNLAANSHSPLPWVDQSDNPVYLRAIARAWPLDTILLRRFYERHHLSVLTDIRPALFLHITPDAQTWAVTEALDQLETTKNRIIDRTGLISALISFGKISGSDQRVNTITQQIIAESAPLFAQINPFDDVIRLRRSLIDRLEYISRIPNLSKDTITLIVSHLDSCFPPPKNFTHESTLDLRWHADRNYSAVTYNLQQVFTEIFYHLIDQPNVPEDIIKIFGYNSTWSLDALAGHPRLPDYPSWRAHLSKAIIASMERNSTHEDTTSIFHGLLKAMPATEQISLMEALKKITTRATQDDPEEYFEAKKIESKLIKIIKSSKDPVSPKVLAPWLTHPDKDRRLAWISLVSTIPPPRTCAI